MLQGFSFGEKSKFPSSGTSPSRALEEMLLPLLQPSNNPTAAPVQREMEPAQQITQAEVESLEATSTLFRFICPQPPGGCALLQWLSHLFGLSAAASRSGACGVAGEAHRRIGGGRRMSCQGFFCCEFSGDFWSFHVFC